MRVLDWRRKEQAGCRRRDTGLREHPEGSHRFSPARRLETSGKQSDRERLFLTRTCTSWFWLDHIGPPDFLVTSPGWDWCGKEAAGVLVPLDIPPPGELGVLDWRMEEQKGAGRLPEMAVFKIVTPGGDP